MRILFATDQYAPTPGGITVVVQRLSQELAKKGHEVAIIAPSQSWRFHKEMEGEVTVYRVQSILLHKTKKIRYSPVFLYQRRMKKILQSFKPDIVHIETPDAIANSTYEEAVRQHIPVMGTCHIMPQNIAGALPFLPSQIGRFVGNMYMRQLATLFNKIDFVTAPTETGIAILKANGVTIPMEALSNGIDLSRFHTLPEKGKEELRKKLALPDRPLILYVGRFDKEKRVDVLIRALARLKGKVPFHGAIVGTGEQKEILEGLVQQLKLTEDVQFLHGVDEETLIGLYNVACVFVMPSTAELQSLVTMEAMAIGKPVIGARAGALPYLIATGENGYLFTPDNASDLADKIKKVISSPTLQKKMGEASLKKIQLHDINVVIEKLESIYTQVISENRAYPKPFIQFAYEAGNV